MLSAGRPRWQQVTALVSLTAGGAITGFSFVPRAAADLASPTGMPIRLLALHQSAKQPAADDALLRSAIVNVAHYYLRMAKGETPAEMQAVIWQNDSIDGADHGASCAAFASLTLELAARAVGQHSWVTGGGSYPWPLHRWADVRVDPNPASPGIISIRQDAEAHNRWHPLGDGYRPMPGDWVMFHGHVQVVTQYQAGVLHTIGGDSLPNFSVNARAYNDPLAAQGVLGFVNNGNLPGAAKHSSHAHEHQPVAQPAAAEAADGLAAIPGAPMADAAKPTGVRAHGGPGVPATPTAGANPSADHNAARRAGQLGRIRAAHESQPPGRGTPHATVTAKVPGTSRSAPGHGSRAKTPGTAAIPGLAVTAHDRSAEPKSAAASHRYSRHDPSPVTAPLQEATGQQAFISAVAPGAIAAQHRYGVPAAVTIAQAIDESAWGQSSLATKDHNLFGIKGTGPAGSDALPTHEYANGQSVATTAPFRVYHSAAQSIDDHGRLLATSGYYRRAMADRHDPNAFAAALTGVYATDPSYGAKLVDLMRQYDLYRYDVIKPAGTPHSASPGGRSATSRPHPARTPPPGVSSPAPSPGASSPSPSHSTPAPSPSHSPPPPSPSHSNPAPSPSHSTPPPSPSHSPPAPSPPPP